MGAIVAIDGSWFKSVINRDTYFTDVKLQRRMQAIEASIARYLDEHDSASRQRSEIIWLRIERLREGIVAI